MVRQGAGDYQGSRSPPREAMKQPHWLGKTDSKSRRCRAVKPGVGRCSKKVHEGSRHAVGGYWEYECFYREEWLACRDS